jgi:putative transcriptional regulator
MKRASEYSKMAVSYRKLRHILIDRGMKKKDLEEAAGITHYQMYKLANDKDITTDVIGAICTALEVSVHDILEFVPVKEK